MSLLLILYLCFCIYLLYKITRSGIWKCHRSALDGIKSVYFSIGVSQVVSLGVLGLSRCWEFDVPIVRLLITLCLLQATVNLLIVTLLNNRRCDYSRGRNQDVRGSD